MREIRWDQVPTDTFDLSGHVTGWGATLSVEHQASTSDVLRLQAVYGEGIENYFNDAPVDVGRREPISRNRRTPLTGEALPIFGAVVYLDHTWNTHFTLGDRLVDGRTSTTATRRRPNAFHNGQYASTISCGRRCRTS